jgi:hypothetical protein
MRLNSAALFALAVSTAAPVTPARAVVPGAPAWTQSTEINQLVIKVVVLTKAQWEDQKTRRRGRGRTCIEYDSRPSCEADADCKWQKGTPFGVGYCYARSDEPRRLGRHKQR